MTSISTRRTDLSLSPPPLILSPSLSFSLLPRFSAMYHHGGVCTRRGAAWRDKSRQQAAYPSFTSHYHHQCAVSHCTTPHHTTSRTLEIGPHVLDSIMPAIPPARLASALFFSLSPCRPLSLSLSLDKTDFIFRPNLPATFPRPLLLRSSLSFVLCVPP